MKEILLLMARYNREADLKMMECFRKAGEAGLKKDLGLYYKSIWGTFEHMLGGYISMFGAVFRKYCKDPDVFKDHVFTLGSWGGLKSEADKDLNALIETSGRLNNVIISMVQEMEDLTKIETLEFPGVKFEKPRYQLVMGMFIHGTHHRGQIAAGLDILGIDNDFSSLLTVN